MHGRGGQGAVMASMILARAAHLEGWNVQVFPEFGVERRGVPVTAFARLDRQPIYLRTKVYNPDHIIVLDPALIHFVDVTAGLRQNGWIVINTPALPSAFEFSDRFQVATVDATDVAVRHRIGTQTSPIVNTTMVGAFSRATGLVSMESVKEAIAQTISGVAANLNFEAAQEAFEQLILPLNVLQEAFTRSEEAFTGGDA
jgi:pyruvate ferredoxin oxidoreductase gamma subunit/2-oxoisovalerate ferredoxin oxidoreductase gamma subunit